MLRLGAWLASDHADADADADAGWSSSVVRRAHDSKVVSQFPPPATPRCHVTPERTRTLTRVRVPAFPGRFAAVVLRDDQSWGRGYVAAMRTGRVVGAILVVAGVLVWPGVVGAHDPIIIDDSQTTPDAGPYLPDGTISFALYGVLGGSGDTRGLRVGHADGDRFVVSLLVPDLPPEQTLSVEELPTLTVVAPDGTSRTFVPDTRVVFDEPFTGTRYLRLLDLDEPAVAGEYELTVSGSAPARFTVSVGTLERFGTPADNVVDRAAGVAGVLDWYATAPPVATPPTPTDPSVTAEPPAATVPASTEPPPTSGRPPATSTVSPPSTSTPPSTVSPPDDGGAFGGLVAGAIVVCVVVGIASSVVRRRR